MFVRVPLWITLLAVLLLVIALIGFGALVRRGTSRGEAAGPLDRAALAVADIPATLRHGLHPSVPALAIGPAPPLPDGLAINRHQPVRDDGYALFVRYSAPARRYVVLLTRLADGAVLRRYAPDTDAINARSSIRSPVTDLTRDHGLSHYRMQHPYLTEDGGLVFQDNMTPLVRIDACSRIVWTVDGMFHHALERDAEGDFLVSAMPSVPTRPHVSPRYRDDQIARVTPAGHVVSLTPIGDVLKANGLARLWQLRPYTDDPFHLNDIEPVMEDGPFWRRGDLFVSLRNLSLVALYRPSTGRILWSRQGPWNKQHDVSILDDHRISIFDNRAMPGAGGAPGLTGDWVDRHNRLLIYDFTNDQVTSPYDRGFAAHAIRTVTEGRGTPLPGGDVFIEETNYGRAMRMGVDGTLRWRYVSGDADRRRYMLGWSRYLDPVRFRSSIQAAARARCT